MKRFLIVALSLFMAWPVHAVGSVWLSSHTATADTTKALCVPNSGATRVRGLVHTLCVNTGAVGSFSIYNSSASAVNLMAAVNTAAAVCLTYDVALSSGVTYTNSATADVTLTYSCY